MVDHPYPQSRPVRVLPLIAVAFGAMMIGAGAMTLYWQGTIERGFKREAEWRQLVEQGLKAVHDNQETAKRFETIAITNLTTANECLALIKSR